ncbi:MAG TPA: hypothetical protein VK483_06295 [Chitinophagaceae bacterium]|nr:hypothetical protein [Chitinophagaceae bacterium]
MKKKLIIARKSFQQLPGSDQRSDLVTDLPEMSEIRKSTIKTKNKILAIELAPAAIPPKPNTAATMAIIKKITVQRNITLGFKN